MERAARRNEFDRPAGRVEPAGGELRKTNPLLPFSSSRETRYHRLGPGELSLRREHRGHDAQARIRPLLHPSLFVFPRCDDRAEDDSHNGGWPRTLKSLHFLTTDFTG